MAAHRRWPRISNETIWSQDWHPRRWLFGIRKHAIWTGIYFGPWSWSLLWYDLDSWGEPI